jgi:hypothetical protein
VSNDGLNFNVSLTNYSCLYENNEIEYQNIGKMIDKRRSTFYNNPQGIKYFLINDRKYMAF